MRNTYIALIYQMFEPKFAVKMTGLMEMVFIECVES